MLNGTKHPKLGESKKGDKDQESIQSSTTLAPGTTWESDTRQLNITNKSQEVIPFQARDHKAAMNRRVSMRNTRHKKHK